ncbi:AAA family ATPase [Micromonospora antibiotica]|uniref:AAA family ATPase n=1 Tax=Micromonospora antibiotica TaxID=2807623 RepID=A0ABS3V8P1_9ACTN|nr:AAA family ATPase [Micromonospora antibiotica]MBO4161982.1 AAA family ATPase [Micromonospora antibiotica]
MSTQQVGVELRLLGPVRALRDGTELVLGSARRTAVLCVLALRAGEAVSRDQLVDAVWGDDPPQSAAGNVYTYVSTLRQLLEPARGRWTAGRLLSSGGGSYQLHLTPTSVDVLRFESLHAQAQRQRSTGHTDAELNATAAALRLWRGEAFAGVPGPFAEQQRSRLTALRIATAERYAELLTGRGRQQEAAQVLRELMTAHPHREEPRRTFVVAPPVAARPTDSRVSTGGSRPVGSPVAARPVELASRSTVPSAGIPAAAPAEPPVRIDAAPLLGRDRELLRLRRAVTGVAAGRGGSILLEGPAGIGKTALLRAALPHAPAGCRLGWAVGDEATRDAPSGTLRDCVESALTTGPGRRAVGAQATAADPGGEPGADQAGDRLLADWGDQVDATDPDRTDADVATRTVQLVRRATTETPLILVIDDLHWADPATLRAWETLGAQARELPLLLVAAVRSGAERAVGPATAETLTLGPLDSRSAGALVRAVASPPPEPDDLTRILDDADGHPQYLRQLATEGIDPFPGSGLVAAVTAHLSPFPDDTRQVLRAVAFLSAYEVRAPGSQPAGCTMAEVGAVTGHPADDLARMLAPVRAAGILAPGDRLRLRHRVVARTLCESTPAALRVTLCRRYAQRLAEAGTAPERVVALMLVGKALVDECSANWLAEHVERVAEAAPGIAIAVLAQAHAQHTLDPARRLTLTAWLARLLLRADRNAAAEAGWVAARTADPELAGEMRWIAAHSHERRGDFETAAQIAHAALRERRIGGHWIEQLRLLLGRIRPSLPGKPTEPQLSRSRLLGGGRPSVS